MKIIVVAHDAGGAEIVSSWVKANSQHDYRFCLKGPARNIFSKKMEWIEFQIDLFGETLVGFDLMLTGTSANDLERSAIQVAKKSKLRVASYIDHWVYYRERFGYPNIGWDKNIPDEVWCGDIHSLHLWESYGFEGKLVENEYFSEIKDRYNDLNSARDPSFQYDAIFMSEPTAEHMERDFGDPLYAKFNEYTLLEDFIHNVCPQMNFKKILIRLHPADFAGKFDEILSKAKHLEILISGQRLLEFDLHLSDVVFGGESMALVASTIVGKKVFSLIPKSIKKLSLPFDEISQFQ